MMSIEMIRSLLLWCSVINFVILFVWFSFFVLAHDFIHRLHGRWFCLSVEQFDAVHYGAMAVYKIGILFLNIVPLIALWIIA